MTGTLIVPLWEDGGFRNRGIPLQIHVALEVTSDQLAKERWWNYQGRALVASVGCLLSLAVGIPLVVLWIRREVRGQWASIGPGPAVLAILHLVFNASFLWPIWRYWQIAFQ